MFFIVRDVEEKRFSLVFPKERGFVRGWKILSSKLRSLGVSLIQRRVEESKATSKKVLVPSGIGNKKEGSIVEAMPFGSFEQCNAMWIEIEKEVINKNEEAFNRSLVGRWRDFMINPQTSSV